MPAAHDRTALLTFWVVPLLMDIATTPTDGEPSKPRRLDK